MAEMLDEFMQESTKLSDWLTWLANEVDAARGHADYFGDGLFTDNVIDSVELLRQIEQGYDSVEKTVNEWSTRIICADPAGSCSVVSLETVQASTAHEAASILIGDVLLRWHRFTQGRPLKERAWDWDNIVRAHFGRWLADQEIDYTEANKIALRLERELAYVVRSLDSNATTISSNKILWHAANETPPEQFKHGPLQGLKRELAHWIRPHSKDSKPERALNTLLRRGIIWGREDVRQRQCSIWFTSTTAFGLASDQAKNITG